MVHHSTGIRIALYGYYVLDALWFIGWFIAMMYITVGVDATDGKDHRYAIIDNAFHFALFPTVAYGFHSGDPKDLIAFVAIMATDLYSTLDAYLHLYSSIATGAYVANAVIATAGLVISVYAMVCFIVLLFMLRCTCCQKSKTKASLASQRY